MNLVFGKGLALFFFFPIWHCWSHLVTGIFQRFKVAAGQLSALEALFVSTQSKAFSMMSPHQGSWTSYMAFHHSKIGNWHISFPHSSNDQRHYKNQLRSKGQDIEFLHLPFPGGRNVKDFVAIFNQLHRLLNCSFYDSLTWIFKLFIFMLFS